MKRRNPSGICQVCTQNESKYCCPICSMKYCSVKCFKVHKESMCETQSWMSSIIEKQETENKKAAIDTAAVQHNQQHIQRQQQQQQNNTNANDTPRETEETYRVSDRQLKSLAANEALRRALGDPELCELLEKIDLAKDRERVLDEALDTNPDFAAFINTMLQSIGVRDIEGNCTLR